MGGSENWAPTPNSKREMVLPSAEKNFRTIIMKEKNLVVWASSFVGPVFILRISKNKLRRIGRRTVIGKRRCRVHAKDAPVGKFGLDTWNYHVQPHCILFFGVISSCQQFLVCRCSNSKIYCWKHLHGEPVSPCFTLRSPTKQGHSHT